MRDLSNVMFAIVAAPLLCVLVLTVNAFACIAEMTAAMRTYRNGGEISKEDWKTYT